MFGLMKTQKHKPSILNHAANKEPSFYCSLCKSIGSIYGQACRVSLNYDASFLVELLTALSGEVPEKWDKKLHSKNCLSFPSQKNIPEILAFGASVNVLFAGIKIKDNKIDSNSLIWKGLDGLFASKYKKALSYIEKFGLNAEQLKDQLLRNNEREKEKGQSLEYYTEISSLLTGAIFSLGAKVVNRPELKEQLQELGEKFGKLIYLLDAYEDYEQDVRKSRFNALASAFLLSENTLPADLKSENKTLLKELGSEILTIIYHLPIPEKTLQKFKISLNDNLSAKLEQKGVKDKNRFGLKRRLKLSSTLIDLRKNETFIGNRPLNSSWKIAGLAVLAVLMPGQLYAAPDLLGSFNPDQLDLVNNILQDFGLTCDCCEQCCGNCDDCCDGCKDCCDDCGGCCDGCDGCCNNCCDGCCEDCGNAVGRFLIFAAIAFVIFVGGIVFLIIWLVKRSNRKNENLSGGQNRNFSKVPQYLLDANRKLLVNESSVKYLNDLINAQKESVAKKYTNDIVGFLQSVEPNIKQLKLLAYYYKKETGIDLIDELKSLSKVGVVVQRYLLIFIRLNVVSANPPFEVQDWWNDAMLEMFKGSEL